MAALLLAGGPPDRPRPAVPDSGTDLPWSSAHTPLPPSACKRRGSFVALNMLRLALVLQP